MSNTKSSVIDKLISLVPVWGYHHGQSEGFKRGMIEASQANQDMLFLSRHLLASGRQT